MVYNTNSNTYWKSRYHVKFFLSNLLLGYKRHHFVLRDLQLAAYRDARDYEAMGGGAPAFIVSLKVQQMMLDNLTEYLKHYFSHNYYCL